MNFQKLKKKKDNFLPTLKYFDKEGIRPNIFKINGKINHYIIKY